MMSHKTAMHRNYPSGPVKWLFSKSKIHGTVLDYGCGRGADVRFLQSHKFIVSGYDPHFAPTYPEGLKFGTIVCNFVLNVIQDEGERMQALSNIRSLLVDGGKAYVSVRNDKANLKGFTKTGTWQGKVELDLPVVMTTSSWKMYEVTN